MFVMNDEMCGIFRCSLNELENLKQACKQQMLETYVNGSPFLDQLPEGIDGDGAIRDDMWHSIEESNAVFKSMLSGLRWRGVPPFDFKMMVEEAKTCIVYDMVMMHRAANRLQADQQNAANTASNEMRQISCGLYSQNRNPRSLSNGIQKRVSLHKRRKTIAGPHHLDVASYPESSDPLLDQISDCDHNAYVSSAESASPQSEASNMQLASPDPVARLIDFGRLLPPVTPLNDSSISGSDSNLSQDDATDSAFSDSRDPFRDSLSPDNTKADAYAMDSGVDMSARSRLSFAPRETPFQTPTRPPASRYTLSSGIQRAVNDALAGVEARLTSLEDTTARLRSVDSAIHALLTKMVADIGAMMMAQETEIEHLKNKLEQERLWRAT